MAQPQSLSRQAGISTYDPIWQRVRDEAEAALRREPALGGFIFATILNHKRLEDAIGHRIAQRLGHGGIEAGLLFDSFDSIVEENSELANIFRADLVAVLDRDPACSRLIEPLLYFKGFHAVQTHRFANAFYRQGRLDLAYYLQSQSSSAFGIDIHPAAELGRGIFVDHGHAIVIGETAKVEDDVSILHNVTLGGTGKECGDRHPKIGKGVLIGAGAKILGNISVGHCARIAAGSVVLKDVPPKKTVAGVPAKIVGDVECPEPARAMDQLLATLDDLE